MNPQVLNTTTRTSIHALISSAEATAAAARKATQRAQQERERIDTLTRQAQEEQAARERELDNVVAQVIDGLQAIMSIGRTREIQALVKARSAIRQHTAIFSEGDENAVVGVYFQQKHVELYIHSRVIGNCQSVNDGAARKYVNCRIKRQCALRGKKQIDPKWFHLLFHADLSREWYEFEFDQEQAQRSWEHRASSPVGDYDLRKFARLNIADLQKDDTLSWSDDLELNLVLMRFLADCADQGKLAAYLESALQGLAD